MGGLRILYGFGTSIGIATLAWWITRDETAVTWVLAVSLVIQGSWKLFYRWAVHQHILERVRR